VVFTKHSLVLSYRSLYLFVPIILNSLLLLFSDFGVRFLDQVLRFLYCSAHFPSFIHFGYIQGREYVRLFQLDTSAKKYSVRVEWLRQRHPGGRLLRARRQYTVSHCRSPSDHCFSVSSCSVGLQFSTITLA